MQNEVIYEMPILRLEAYTGCNGGYHGCGMDCQSESIDLYMDDLKKAQIGKQWTVEDVDRCPNASERWTKSFTKVYENAEGIAVVFTSQSDYEEDKIYWIRKREENCENK